MTPLRRILSLTTISTFRDLAIASAYSSAFPPALSIVAAFLSSQAAVQPLFAVLFPTRRRLLIPASWSWFERSTRFSAKPKRPLVFPHVFRHCTCPAPTGLPTLQLCSRFHEVLQSPLQSRRPAHALRSSLPAPAAVGSVYVALHSPHSTTLPLPVAAATNRED